MLGDFIIRSLVMLLGYAYPAFECFKTVEKNKADIEQLRFWCQYWIIVAMLTVFERVGDIFVSWLPMYGELKLGFVIYLWYPKTKGTNYVYETFLRPCIAKHETDIDRKLLEWRARVWDLAVFYWQNFASHGQAKFFEILRYVAAQSYRPPPTTHGHVDPTSAGAKRTSPPASFTHRPPDLQRKPPISRKQPPSAPPPPNSIKRAEFQPPKADQISETPPETADYIRKTMDDDENTPGTPTSPVGKSNTPESGENTLHAARLRLRRAQHRPE